MRRRLFVISVAAVAIALGSGRVASAAGAPNYPKPPKPDFSSMQFLIGTWSCSSKSARRPSAVASTDVYSFDPTGYYLVDTTRSAGSPWFPFASTTTSMTTYDAEEKKWASVTTSTLGDYGLATSPGWSDGRIVWHSALDQPYLDIASNADFTMTKISDTKLTGASSFKTKSGDTVSVASTCTKAS